MAAMAEFPDKFFDLAVVDPPYGIENKISNGGGSHTKSKSKFHNRYKENGKKWDIRPEKKYWDRLFMVSKNQIVFGANYFTEYLPVSRGWVYWHKQGEGISTVNDELIWTSFDVSIKKFSRCHGMDKGFMSDHKVFHPTTKPVALYDWIYKNYLPNGGKVLDTHLGSGSNRIAADKAGNIDFWGYELDKDYYEAQEKRWKDYKAQIRMF